MASATRPRLGDVVEINTPDGFAYAQYVNKDKTYGALIRVLPGVYEHRPDDLNAIAAQEERFFVFFPLAAALREGAVRAVGSAIIPESARQMPTMRMPGLRDASGRPESWWLWQDGEERRLPRLGPDERRLSIAAVVNDTLLIDRIISGWTPADEG